MCGTIAVVRYLRASAAGIHKSDRFCCFVVDSFHRVGAWRAAATIPEIAATFIASFGGLYLFFAPFRLVSWGVAGTCFRLACDSLLSGLSLGCAMLVCCFSFSGRDDDFRGLLIRFQVAVSVLTGLLARARRRGGSRASANIAAGHKHAHSS